MLFEGPGTVDADVADVSSVYVENALSPSRREALSAHFELEAISEVSLVLRGRPCRVLSTLEGETSPPGHQATLQCN